MVESGNRRDVVKIVFGEIERQKGGRRERREREGEGEKRERGRGREGKREERERDRQTDRQRQRDRQKDGDRHTHTHRKTEISPQTKITKILLNFIEINDQHYNLCARSTLAVLRVIRGLIYSRNCIIRTRQNHHHRHHTINKKSLKPSREKKIGRDGERGEKTLKERERGRERGRRRELEIHYQ